MDKRPLVLFDASALVHRAYHAFATTKPLTISKTGEVTSAVYGFANMLLKVLGEQKPGCYAMAFDMKGPTFRHELDDQYKAHRKATPDELISQLGRVRQLVEAFNIPIFELSGYEADDILGALARQASGQGMAVIIVTGDADMMQLVTPDVKVLYPKRGGAFSDTMLYDEAAVRKRYGVLPSQIADLKALVGDTSDNIPGVSGIGQKTGVKLIQQFGSIDTIYARIDEITPEKLRDKLASNEAAARRSLQLAAIVTRLPLELKLEDCRVSNFDRQKVTDLFRELEFGSLLPRLPQVEIAVPARDAVPAATLEQEFHIVDDEKALGGLVVRLKKAGAFAFDTETTGLDTMAAQLVGISISPAAGEAYYIPVGHVGWGEVKQLDLAKVVAALKPLFADGNIAKTAHNAKYDITIVAEHGMEVANLVFDTMLAAYLLGEKSISLKALSFSRLGIECQTIAELIGKGV